MIKLFLYALLFLPFIGITQTLTLLTDLDSDVEETSGLIYLNGKIITHNDSGGDPYLYEVNPSNGNPTRIVNVVNAVNNDWEDICYDDEYIYIGDFGNNEGTRTNLHILKIAKSDYFDSDTTVVAEFINYNYAEQLDYNPNNYTNFDAEALISYGDSLYIFTKNRGNFKTNVYVLPKEAGNYEVSSKEEYNISGLVTGATFSPQNNQVLLSGYSFSSTFIAILSGFENSFFLNGNVNVKPLDIPEDFSNQIESITYINGNQFYMSGEETDFTEEALYLLDISAINNLDRINERSLKLFPNPVLSDLNIEEVLNGALFTIYDMKGRLVLKGGISDGQIDVSLVNSGIYYLRIVDQSNAFTTSFIKL